MAPFKPVKVYLLTQAFGVGGALLFAAAGIAFSSMKTDHWAAWSRDVAQRFAIAWPWTSIAIALISARLTWHHRRWFWMTLVFPGIAAPLALLFVDGL